ncbi:hypothetical protein ACFCX4_19395 [Kitasatospora sp. NPDC056327]|uniref:hypothetical protein n=1 Tax=Kitasatospora sp. NPDC056327 TaxID=3345785 RepID=UPI0035DDB94D
MNRIKRLAAVAAATAVAALAPLAAAPAAQAAPTANHPGLTWELLDYGAGHAVLVGGPGGSVSDPYHGDTPASETLPLLCLDKDYRPAPPGIQIGFYTGWAQGEVRISRPVRGTELTSPDAANAVCRAQYGSNWRQAEFHDGRYGPNYSQRGGWTFWANGELPKNVRFWVRIDDQPANPWS